MSTEVSPSAPAPEHGASGEPPSATGALRLGQELVRNFAVLPKDEAADAIATHIKKFWEPRIRHELMANIRMGNTSLHPLLVLAAEHLMDEQYDHVEAQTPSGG